MIIALSPVTIGGAPPLREYVSLAEKYGFGGVEFDIDQAIELAEETSWDSVGNLFEQYGVAPSLFWLPVDWQHDDISFRNDLAHLSARAKAATLIGCSRTASVLPTAVDGDVSEFKSLIEARLLSVAEILCEYNIRLALEFVGPQTSRMGLTAAGAHPFIYSVAQTVDLIETINAPNDNIGLLIDSFHWYTSDGSTENLAMLPESKIVHVHISDAPNVPIDKQYDFQRLLPGDGVIDLKIFLRTLATVGYRGFVAVEVFNKTLSDLGADRAAQKTELALEKLLATL